MNEQIEQRLMDAGLTVVRKAGGSIQATGGEHEWLALLSPVQQGAPALAEAAETLLALGGGEVTVEGVGAHHLTALAGRLLSGTTTSRPQPDGAVDNPVARAVLEELAVLQVLTGGEAAIDPSKGAWRNFAANVAARVDTSLSAPPAAAPKEAEQA